MRLASRHLPASAKATCSNHMLCNIIGRLSYDTNRSPIRRQDLSPTDDTDHGDVAVEYESMVAGDQ